MDLLPDIILVADHFLTGCQTEQVTDKVNYPIRAGILFITLLLVWNSGCDEPE